MLNWPIALLALAGGAYGARRLGAYRWTALTRKLRSQLDAAALPMAPAKVDFTELEGLPAPVERYFRAALKRNAPMVTGAHARHMGTFNMSANGERWKAFTSEQKIVARRPGFDWSATIDMFPGLRLRVHDAYVAGEGVLRASLLGLVDLMRQQGAGPLAEGELMRFYAEAAWYPTALLPSQGVQWQAVDESSAYAIVADGGVRLALMFTFNEQGLIETVGVEARGRAVDGEFVPTPWQGRFWNYAQRGGMRVPLEGEVAWMLPDGPQPYWRGRLIEVNYEFAR